jgi:polyhydroxybutyrate depolymerase
MRGILVGALAVLLAGEAAAQPLPPGTHPLELAHGGRIRLVVIHRPPQPGPLPLVVMLHGAGDTARNAMTTYGWDRLGDRGGIAVATPQALRLRPDDPAGTDNPFLWNDGDPAMPGRPVDDVDFVAAVIATVAARTPVARGRVFLAGFGDGGAMAMRAGAVLAEHVRAVAAVAGIWWEPQRSIMPRVSLLLIAGGADPTMPWWGGDGRDPLGRPAGRPAVMASAEAWGRALGCPTAGAASRDMPPSLVVWWGCPDGAAVRLVTRRTLGHAWPVGVTPGRAMADEIWRFFAAAAER